MNTFVTFACLLAVLGACHSNPIGYGLGLGYGNGGLGYGYGGLGYGYGGVIAPALSSANIYKAAPIISTYIAPAISTVPVLKSVGGWGGYGGLGSIGYGYGGSLGYGYGLGSRGLGLGGKSLGLGWGGLH